MVIRQEKHIGIVRNAMPYYARNVLPHVRVKITGINQPITFAPNAIYR